MSCGAMFLPDDVTIRSFLRPVMRRNPSSITPVSPECIQPSWMSSAVAAGSSQ
jgi:hypothetical protein